MTTVFIDFHNHIETKPSLENFKNQNNKKSRGEITEGEKLIITVDDKLKKKDQKTKM